MHADMDDVSLGKANGSWLEKLQPTRGDNSTPSARVYEHSVSKMPLFFTGVLGVFRVKFPSGSFVLCFNRIFNSFRQFSTQFGSIVRILSVEEGDKKRALCQIRRGS